MKSIDIPMNLKMKINGKPYPKKYRAGKFSLSAKISTPTWIMLLYVSFRIFIKSFQSLMRMQGD